MNGEDALQLLQYVKQHHSIEFDGVYHRGWLDCHKRLEYLQNKIDFSDKIVLDIGCNIGGMLFPLAKTIKRGVGIDCNPRAINAANYLKSLKRVTNLDFFAFNLIQDELTMIDLFVSDIDIVFLSAECAFARNWRMLIDFIAQRSDIFILEAGTENSAIVNKCKSTYRCAMRFCDLSDLETRSLYAFSKYPLTEYMQLLGSNCWSQVYKIDDHTCKKILATPHEILFYQLVRHDSITKLIGYTKIDSSYHMYLELGGLSLAQIVSRGENLERYKKPLQVMLESALEVLEEKGIRHGDIHPGNIVWFEDQQRFKLIDPILEFFDGGPGDLRDRYASILCYLCLIQYSYWKNLNKGASLAWIFMRDVMVELQRLGIHDEFIERLWNTKPTSPVELTKLNLDDIPEIERRIAETHDIRKHILGDESSKLPEFTVCLMRDRYWPKLEIKHKFGVICEGDTNSFTFTDRTHHIREINPRDLVNAILQCEVICSNTLQGLVLAVAYEKPCVWLGSENNPKISELFRMLGVNADFTQSVKSPPISVPTNRVEALIQKAGAEIQRV